MAKVVAGGSHALTEDLLVMADLAAAVVANAAGGAFTYLMPDGGKTVVTGSGFTFANGRPAGGTITGLSVFDANGNPLFEIASAKIDVLVLQQAIDIGDATLFATKLLAGNDSLVGAAGNDDLAGHDGNDYLSGGNGADTLNGGAGNDTLDAKETVDSADVLFGGSGDDQFIVYSDNDIVSERENGGIDTVRTYVSRRLDYQVEHGVLESSSGSVIRTLTGNGMDNRLTGSVSRDRLVGEYGADTLDGGAGIDTMEGGAGGDWYVVDNVGDVIVEDYDIPSAIDHVFTSINYILGEHLEHGTIIGGTARVLTGNLGDNALTGSTGADTLMGRAGHDRLVGGGGNDLMGGGAGNDTYVVGDTGDVVSELAGEGRDLIETSVSFTLVAEVENGRVTGTTAGRILTGNAKDNVLSASDVGSTLRGLGGNDTLTGGIGGDSLDGGADNDSLDGGAGADSLRGGSGNDEYFVDHAGDLVIEAAGGGADTVFATADHILAANVESLSFGFASFLPGGSTLTLRGTGNQDANRIDGHNGTDILDGRAGADTLKGGSGDDTYLLNSIIDEDEIVELAGGGIDTVRSIISHTLDAHVENLILGSYEVGTRTVYARQGIGNGEANVLTGNAGNNGLDGKAGADRLIGGRGDDTLTGGTGNDTFVVGPNGGSDLVLDFDANPTGGQDKIDVSAFGFYSFAAMKLAGTEILGDNVDAVIRFADGSELILEDIAGGVRGITASDFIFAV